MRGEQIDGLVQQMQERTVVRCTVFDSVSQLQAEQEKSQDGNS